MYFEVHVAQEAEAAVAALELDGLVELGYRNNINPKSKKKYKLVSKNTELRNSLKKGDNIAKNTTIPSP